jgi:hypothetical protein
MLRVADPDAVDRVCSFLTSVGVRWRSEGETILCLSVPGAPTPLHEHRELAGWIATWNALNPRSKTDLILPE